MTLSQAKQLDSIIALTLSCPVNSYLVQQHGFASTTIRHYAEWHNISPSIARKQLDELLDAKLVELSIYNRNRRHYSVKIPSI